MEKKNRFAGANNPVENLPYFKDKPEATETAAEETATEETAENKTVMGRPRKNDIQREKGAGKGLQKGSTRYTVIYHDETLDFLQDYAYTKRTTIKEALTMIIDNFKREYYSDPNAEPIIPDPKYIEKRKERDKMNEEGKQ